MTNFSAWVSLPGTGREIDVAPLLKALDQFDDQVNSPVAFVGPRDVIRRTIRALNVTVHDPHINKPLDMANLYRDLHLLEEVFDRIIEREQAA